MDRFCLYRVVKLWSSDRGQAVGLSWSSGQVMDVAKTIRDCKIDWSSYELGPSCIEWSNYFQGPSCIERSNYCQG